MDIAAFAMQLGMRNYLNHNVEVPGRTTSQTDVPLSPQPQPGPIVHPSGDIDRDLTFFLDSARPVATMTRLLESLPLAVTLRAGTDVDKAPEKALLTVLNLASSAASWASSLGGPRLHSASLATVASDEPGHGELHLRAIRGVL